MSSDDISGELRHNYHNNIAPLNMKNSFLHSELLYDLNRNQRMQEIHQDRNQEDLIQNRNCHLIEQMAATQFYNNRKMQLHDRNFQQYLNSLMMPHLFFQSRLQSPENNLNFQRNLHLYSRLGTTPTVTSRSGEPQFHNVSSNFSSSVAAEISKSIPFFGYNNSNKYSNQIFSSTLSQNQTSANVMIPDFSSDSTFNSTASESSVTNALSGNEIFPMGLDHLNYLRLKHQLISKSNPTSLATATEENELSGCELYPPRNKDAFAAAMNLYMSSGHNATTASFVEHLYNQYQQHVPFFNRSRKSHNSCSIGYPSSRSHLNETSRNNDDDDIRTVSARPLFSNIQRTHRQPYESLKSRRKTDIPVTLNLNDLETKSVTVDSPKSTNSKTKGSSGCDSICYPINLRSDLMISDQDLILMKTKALNKLLRKKGVSKIRAKQIKSERRTLKNRGYAASCRVKRDDEEISLKLDIAELTTSITELRSQRDSTRELWLYSYQEAINMAQAIFKPKSLKSDDNLEDKVDEELVKKAKKEISQLYEKFTERYKSKSLIDLKEIFDMFE